VLLKNVFEIPAYDAETTVEWQETIEQSVRQESMAALESDADAILGIVVEEREVQTPLFFLLFSFLFSDYLTACLLACLLSCLTACLLALLDKLIFHPILFIIFRFRDVCL
jgi:hypothetical protein